MSKKINATENVAITATKSLEEYFEEYPNVSLRRLAAATGVTYTLLLKKSRQPISGVAYDAAAINWEALEEYLAKKDVVLSDINWEELNETTKRTATLCKDMDQFTVGTKVWLRKDNTTPYEIVYKTATHVVLMLEGTSEPIAWSNNTFLINGPAFQPRAEKVEEEA